MAIRFSFTFTLPDGTTQTLKLQAISSGTPGPNQFAIGATSDITADNLQAALAAGVTQIGTDDAAGRLRHGRFE